MKFINLQFNKNKLHIYWNLNKREDIHNLINVSWIWWMKYFSRLQFNLVFKYTSWKNIYATLVVPSERNFA